MLDEHRPAVARFSRGLAYAFFTVGAVACTEPLATDPTQGQILWRHEERGGHPRLLPYADDEIAVFGNVFGSRVVALGSQDGKKRWDTHVELPREFREGPGAGLPIVGRLVGTGGMVIVPAYDLYGLDRATGQIRWKLAPPDDFPGVDATLGGDGAVYSVGHHLYRIDPTTGAVYWRADLGEQPFAPVEQGGVVYVGTRGLIPGTNVLGSGHAVAVDASTGAVLWKTPIPAPEDRANGGIVGVGALTPELYIVSSPNGRVYAIERTTGRIRWETKGSAGYYGSGVVVVGDVAVTANGTAAASPTGVATGYVEAFDLATGQPRWRVDVEGQVLRQLATDGRTVFAVTGWLWAINAEGQRLWRHMVKQAVPYATGARVHAGTIYIGVSPGGSSSGVGEGFYALRVPR